jgi:Cu2+-exporting ATPase
MLDKVRHCTCFHCQDTMPAATALVATVDGVEQRFCCKGCIAAAQLIESLHLENFYTYREQCPTELPRAKNTRQTKLLEFSHAITVREDGLSELRLLIPDIHCVACVWLLEQVIGKQTGVNEVSVHFAKRRMRVVFSPEITAAQIVEVINQLGYSAIVDEPDLARQSLDQLRRSMLMRLGVAGIGMMPVMMFALASQRPSKILPVVWTRCTRCSCAGAAWH